MQAAGTPLWELYEGSPSTVKSLREQRTAEDATSKVEAAIAKTVITKGSAKAEPGLPKKPRLTQKELRRLVEVETQMAALHEHIAALDAILSSPSAFLTADAPGQQALKDRDDAKAALEVLEMAWMELEEKRDDSN